MQEKPYPTITLYPSGPSRVRFELRLSERYMLTGDYVRGELKGVTLRKQAAPASTIQAKEH